MLNFFRRSQTESPIPEEQRAWIEERFRWLIQRFSIERLQRTPMVVPNEDFLPTERDASTSTIEFVMRKVASVMNVEHLPFCIKFHPQDIPKLEEDGKVGAEPTIHKPDDPIEIWIEEETLDSPVRVIARISHEISRYLLVEKNGIRNTQQDVDAQAELHSIFMGMGLFTANAALYDNNWSDTQFDSWLVQRDSSMSLDMNGYALALYALARSEPSPSWMKELRPDVRSAMKKSIRYLLARNSEE